MKMEIKLVNGELWKPLRAVFLTLILQGHLPDTFRTANR